MSVPASSRQPARPIWKRWWVWLIVAFVVLALVGGVARLFGYEPADDAAPAESVSESAAESSSEAVESSEPAVDTSELAADVEAALVEGLAVDALADTCDIDEYTWPCDIVEFQGTDEEGKIIVVLKVEPDRAGSIDDSLRGVFQLTCKQIDGLERVELIDTVDRYLASGKRSDYPLCA